MGQPIRISGMNSGLDTENIVKALVSGYKTKQDKVKKSQQKNEWQQEIWKTTNSKVYSFYTGLDKVRFSSSYKSKKTTVSDPTKASVTASGSAVNGTQKLKVESMAQAGYLTGGKLDSAVGRDTKLSQLGIEAGATFSIQNGKSDASSITIEGDMTVNDLMTKMRDSGINASFDADNHRIFLSAKETGADNDFTLTGTNSQGIEALKALGIYTMSDSEKASLKKTADLGTYSADGTLDEAATKSALLDRYTPLHDKLNTADANLAAKTLERSEKESELAERQDIVDYLGAKILVNGYDESANHTEDEVTAYNEAKAKLEKYDEWANSADGLDADGNAIGANLKYYIKESQKDGADLQSLQNFNIRKRDTFQSEKEALESEVSEALKEWNAAVSEWKSDPVFAGIDITDPAMEADTAVQRAYDMISAAKTAYDTADSEGSVRIKGQDAKIYLNGAEFTSASNKFDINGLTINVTGTTGDDEISITTSFDTEGVYDKIKDFLSQYNDLINELQGLYNADAAKNMEPLTDDQKDEMSDTEIEKWETKIKDALLRRDSNLGNIISTMSTSMSKAYTVTMADGSKQTMGLASLGVHTLGFMNSETNKQYAIHIDGDADDEKTSSSADKLKAMIESDPDAVADLFSQVVQGLYTSIKEKISTTNELKSMFSIYNDKQLKSTGEKLTKQVSEWDDKLADYEDFYYNKFTAMEKSLAKLNSSQSALSGMLG